MRRVIKFGGTSIATPELVRNAAEHVARLVQFGEQVAVVVSAPGDMTSRLLDAMYRASENAADFADSSAFASLGEEQSVHLMCAALRSYGIGAHGFLPRNAETWPIIADCEDFSPMSTAKVNEERPFTVRAQQTQGRFRRYVLPHLRVGSVPVIAGFFVMDGMDRVMAMGRGGSDITAFLVGNYVNADEVVIVTDVQGVLSADPRLAQNPRVLEELSLHDLAVITSAGARVVHPRSLEFKNEHMRVRLLDYRELDRLEETGTSVLGRSETTLYRNPHELSTLVLVGELSDPAEVHRLLLDLMNQQGVKPAGTSTSQRFICIYLPSSVAEATYAKLHEELVSRLPENTSLSLRGGVGELRLRSAKFLDEPGVLAEVTGVLGNARINIIEMITALTDISVFIDQKDMDRAEELLSRVLEQYTGQ